MASLRMKLLAQKPPGTAIRAPPGGLRNVTNRDEDAALICTVRPYGIERTATRLAERAVSCGNPSCHSRVQGGRQRAAAWRSPVPLFFTRPRLLTRMVVDERGAPGEGVRPLRRCRVTSQPLGRCPRSATGRPGREHASNHAVT